MTTTFRPVFVLSLFLSFILPTLFLRYAGDWVLGCEAVAWAQWMGATFFTGTMMLILYGSPLAQRKLAALPDPRIPGFPPLLIQQTTFACNAGVLGCWILYVFVLMGMILMAYNIPLIAWPYAWLWGIASMAVFVTGLHLLMISNNVSMRLEKVEEENQKKTEAKEEEQKERMVEEIVASLKDDSFDSSLSSEERVMIIRKRLAKKRMEEVD